MSSPLVDFVQAQWRERRGPDAECLLLGDGTLHVRELLTPAIVQHVLTAEAWTAVNGLDLDVQNVARGVGDHRALAGEATAHGSIGWIALTRAADDHLEWLIVSRWSNPFDDVQATDTELIAHSTADTRWHIPLADPLAARIFEVPG